MTLFKFHMFYEWDVVTIVITNINAIRLALQVLANFYDRCPCCQGCLKHCVKSRSAHAGHVTQVTFADDRRSPSIHSQSSTSPKRNGRYAVNSYKENIDLQELGNSRNSSYNSLSKQNGGSPGRKVSYAPLPTQPAESNGTPPWTEPDQIKLSFLREMT